MTWFAILLSIIFVILCIALILIILIQPGQSEGLAGAFGSGGMLGSAFGVHAKNRLMKMTTIMVILFFIIIFTFAKAFPDKKGSLGEELEEETGAAAETEAPAEEAAADDQEKASPEKKAEPVKKEEPAKPAENKEKKKEDSE